MRILNIPNKLQKIQLQNDIWIIVKNFGQKQPRNYKLNFSGGELSQSNSPYLRIEITNYDEKICSIRISLNNRINRLHDPAIVTF